MSKEGVLYKPNQIDPDLNERLETLKKYANVEVQKCDELIREQETNLEEHKLLRNKVADFPKLLRRDDWLPINDYAFIRGTYDNTNKFYTHLGCKYFAEKSATQIVQFIERKIKAINDVKEGFEKQKELAKSRLDFVENLFEQQKSDVVEIREPYDEEKIRVKKQSKEEVCDNEFEAMMSRLNELEREEVEENDALESKEPQLEEDIVEIKKEAAQKENEAENLPKGLSQDEFSRFIKCVDDMMVTSDEEDYEDEDEDGEDDLDSDDSLPEIEKKKIETPIPKSSLNKASTSKKRGVRFSTELEVGPTEKAAAEDSETPKSILRNKDEKTPVDEMAVKTMNEEEPEKKILPATDAFKGVFVERNPHTNEPSTSAMVNSDDKKPLSKFKAQRMKHL